VQGYPFDQNLGDSAAALASFSKARALLEGLRQDDPANQKLSERLCNLYLKIGVLHNDDGRVAEAEQVFRATWQVLERLRAGGLEPDVRLATSVFYRLGELSRLTGDLPTALQHHRRGLDLAKQWAAQHPGDVARQLVAACQARLAGTLLRAGELEASLQAYLEALQVYENLTARFPENLNHRRMLAARYEAVADVLGDPDDLNLGRPVEALAYYHKSLAIAEGFAARDANDAQAQRNLAEARLWVAKMLRASDPARAAALYRQALATFAQVYQGAPQNFQFRHDLALSHRGLGIALSNLHQPRGNGKLSDDHPFEWALAEWPVLRVLIDQRCACLCGNHPSE
jgi:tetratricopeptide (TPR) repeat protein